MLLGSFGATWYPPQPMSTRPGPSPARARSRSTVVLFWIAAVALFLGLRAVAVGADAPRTLAHGSVGYEMLVEPPAKAHEARNWALFGSFHTHPTDNYQFWRPQSPLWVYPLAGTFRVFGTSYETLRMTAAAFGLAGLFALGLWGHRRWGPSGAVLAVLMMAVDNVGIFWGRSGILEPIVAAWVALAFYLLDRAFDHLGWAAGAIVVLAMGLGIKLAALPAVPVFALYGIVLLMKAPGARNRNLARLAVVGVAVATGAVLAAWILSPEYQRTLAWNFQHMVGGKDGGSQIDLEILDDDTVGAGLDDLPHRLEVCFLAFSATLLLGAAEAVLKLVDLARRRIGLREVMPVAWLLAFAAAVLGATFFAYRFVLLLGPPLLLLSVDFIHRAAAWARGRGRTALALRMPAGAAAIYVVAHLGAWGYALTRLTHEVKAASDVVQEHVAGRDDAVCIGLWSSPVILETTCRHYYVKKTFNSTREALGSLRPTFLLLLPERDDTRTILKRVWPQLLEAAKPLRTMTIRRQAMTLSEVDPDAAKKPARPKRLARPVRD